TRLEFGCARGSVNAHKLELRVRKIIPQCPAAPNEAGYNVRMKKFQSQYAHFQTLIRLGAFYVNRTCQRMGSGAAIGDSDLDGFEGLRNFIVGNTCQFESLDTSSEHGFPIDGLSRIDLPHRLQSAIVKSPVHVFR